MPLGLGQSSAISLILPRQSKTVCSCASKCINSLSLSLSLSLPLSGATRCSEGTKS